ncbi:NAD(P)-binding domain-containing protein [Pseudarthrobacter sp. J75]|uniref:flavin-containing monooxygenase n=1 Tax=unclassified Pseudarthrobacter TaxID=2647000 RepID=UPI002E818A27|nr:MULTISPECIES: NAD(P)-binding domain-containing protein [unclassified Pseudarthrobacter]MEE2521233.1 NAD(P)-binding domain-containing protein [Pseudarthrobacter sp. J47]MEE2528465.1 NAD(P)-binding domain-containing protein [Pseudarthrobacter sp. J75]
MNSNGATGTLDTLIVGGGQAGLALGRLLRGQGRTFLIVDAFPRVGDAWRQRWDSLRVFTPAKYDGLPGLPFPADALSFPTKDDVAAYLEDYARTFELPIHNGVRIEHLRREGDRFIASADGLRWEARNVVVATGCSQAPNLPEFAAELDPSIVQLHSSQYRNLQQLQDGPVLVVGRGNSGAEIGLEASRAHPTFVAGRPGAEIPVKHGPTAARYFLPLVRFAGMHILTLSTPVGKKVAPSFKANAAPLIRTKSKDLEDVGVKLVPRITGVENGCPVAADGTRLEVANVIWCTGFRDDFSWIDAGMLDGGGLPRQWRGVALDTPGLFFLGQEFLYAATSATLPGVSRDARYLAGKLPAPVHREAASATT